MIRRSSSSLVRLIALVGITLAFPISGEGKTGASSQAAKTSLRDAKADALLNGEFRAGHYLYLYKWQQGENPEVRDVEEQIEKMADLGMNSVYIAGAAEGPLWESILKVCERRRMAVTAQLGGGAYLTKDSNIDRQVAIAVAFIRKYKDHPVVLSFLVKEEPSALFLPRIKEYYTKVLEQVPDAPLYLVHSSLDVSAAQEPPYSKAAGTDRYPLWFEFGTSNNRATPAAAFKWYHTQIDGFYQHAKERGQSFEVVLTNWVMERERTKEQLRSSIYPASITEEERDRTLRRFEGLAQAGNHGLRYGEDGAMFYWKYYRPPTNCMMAMGWLAVMEGADAVSNYAWSGAGEITSGRKAGMRSSGALGWEGEGHPSTVEFAQFLDSVRPFGRLIRTMVKETTPITNQPLGHEFVETAPLKNPLLDIGDQNDLLWRAFSLPGYKGRVVIVVNTQVGQWSGTSPFRLKDSDWFRISRTGDLIDYLPYYLPRKVSVTVREQELACYDLQQRQLIETEADGGLPFHIRPGQGKILFLSPKGSSEAERLFKEFNL